MNTRLNPLDRWLVHRVQRALDNGRDPGPLTARLLARRPAAAAAADRLRHADALLRRAPAHPFVDEAPIPLRPSRTRTARPAVAAAALLMLALGGVWLLTPSAEDAELASGVPVQPTLPDAPAPGAESLYPEAPVLTVGAALEAPLRNEWDRLVRDAAAIWDAFAEDAPDA